VSTSDLLWQTEAWQFSGVVLEIRRCEPQRLTNVANVTTHAASVYLLHTQTDTTPRRAVNITNTLSNVTTHAASVYLLHTQTHATPRRAVNITNTLSTYTHTYIRVFLYSTYKFNSHYALRSPNKQFFRDCLKVSNDSPGRRSLGERSFHRRGPATEKLLSPSLLCVLGTKGKRKGRVFI